MFHNSLISDIQSKVYVFICKSSMSKCVKVIEMRVFDLLCIVIIKHVLIAVMRQN